MVSFRKEWDVSNLVYFEVCPAPTTRSSSYQNNKGESMSQSIVQFSIFRILQRRYLVKVNILVGMVYALNAMLTAACQ